MPIGTLEIQQVSQTSEDEVAKILAKQEVEIAWWKSAPTMETVADIEEQVTEGKAARVADRGAGYQISPGVREEFKVLENNTRVLMEEIAQKWTMLLHRRGIKTDGAFLRITSLARTAEYQKELIAKGYPAAENSTHTKLGAFDILISWFRINRPELLEALKEVLDEISRDNRANCIEEPEIGVYHIAFNRTSIM